jgi:hypothetical protein
MEPNSDGVKRDAPLGSMPQAEPPGNGRVGLKSLVGRVDWRLFAENLEGGLSTLAMILLGMALAWHLADRYETALVGSRFVPSEIKELVSWLANLSERWPQTTRVLGSTSGGLVYRQLEGVWTGSIGGLKNCSGRGLGPRPVAISGGRKPRIRERSAVRRLTTTTTEEQARIGHCCPIHA